jgi:hypothetical protein
MRLVTSKNSGVPSMTSQRASTPAPRAQQLDHAAAARGGVDVPDHPAVEQLARLADAPLERLEPIRRQQ